MKKINRHNRSQAPYFEAAKFLTGSPSIPISRTPMPSIERQLRRVRTKEDAMRFPERLGLFHAPKQYFNTIREAQSRAKWLHQNGLAPLGITVIAIPAKGNYLDKRPAGIKKVFAVPRRYQIPIEQVPTVIRELSRTAHERNLGRIRWAVLPAHPTDGFNQCSILITGAEIRFSFPGEKTTRSDTRSAGTRQDFVYKIRLGQAKPRGKRPDGMHARVIRQTLDKMGNHFPANTAIEVFEAGGQLFFHEFMPIGPLPATLAKREKERLFFTDPNEYYRQTSRIYDREGD